MIYKQYFLRFPNGVHLGQTSLTDSNASFSSDTLFSALYLEALKKSPEDAEWLYAMANEGNLLLSDAFPYSGDEWYVPKPLVRIEGISGQGDSVVKKAFKKLDYIPADKMSQYLEGKLDAPVEAEKLKRVGKHILKTSAAVYEQKDTVPYQVAVQYFNPNCGLHLIIAALDEKMSAHMLDLLDALSFSGIGGKRKSGLGRFEIIREKELPARWFESDGNILMLISTSLPKNDELEAAMTDARYRVVRRSGFVQSSTYADEQLKKKELFMFLPGSCFESRFSGDIYDVSIQGRHPVYRYGKPMFISLTEVAHG